MVEKRRGRMWPIFVLSVEKNGNVVRVGKAHKLLYVVLARLVASTVM